MGVVFFVGSCFCDVDVGCLEVVEGVCFDMGEVKLVVILVSYFYVLVGFEVLYVLILGEGLVI